MGMVEYINPNNHQVSLLGPDRQVITLRKNEKRVLSDYFGRYVPRYLKVLRSVTEQRDVVSQAQSKQPRMALQQIPAAAIQPMKHKINIVPRSAPRSTIRLPFQMKSQTVGKTKLILQEAENYYKSYLGQVNHSISNDVGIGILSFNRLECLQRLIDSIRKYTNLRKTTVFISDESTNEDIKTYLRNIPDMVVLNNSERLGVAGNTNRLMRCLERFKYKFILNDDVEILKGNWEEFYTRALKSSGIHHFCMQQIGLLGHVVKGRRSTLNGFNINTINEKPHGAVFIYDNIASTKVGYMDEAFGLYGMEHVDWSNRISHSGIQSPGYHDLEGSEQYFRIHNEKSVVPERVESLMNARRFFATVAENRSRLHISASEKTLVPSISYIIPFKDSGYTRKGSIKTVIQNIKSQKFPNIDMIIVEQDDTMKLDYNEFSSIQYHLAPSPRAIDPFTKAIAFNRGVEAARCNKVIFHDADMLVQDNYTTSMYNLLLKHSGVHICANVLYLNEESTNKIISSGIVDPNYNLMRSVGYFEGGSLGCTIDAYIAIGGFNEDFIGYGNEDCEFFDRLSKYGNFFNDRTENLIHLFHTRSTEWNACHEKNKLLEATLKGMDMNFRCNSLRSRFLQKYKTNLEKLK